MDWNGIGLGGGGDDDWYFRGWKWVGWFDLLWGPKGGGKRWICFWGRGGEGGGGEGRGGEGDVKMGFGGGGSIGAEGEEGG